MNRKQKVLWVLSVLLTSLLLTGIVVPAFAALTGKTISVYTGFSVQKDGVAFQPKDANGDPVELFAYNGTTYVPARAFSEVMGVPINYDGKTQTVYIGEVPGEKQYLVDVCPPYQNYFYVPLESVNMAGNTYTHAIHLADQRPSWALFNLNGQYETLEFDLGHIDGGSMSGSRLIITLDGETVFNEELYGEMMPTHYVVDVTGAIQMKIETAQYGYGYAMGNVELY